MLRRYEVWVFGQNLENLENEGGWQLWYATFDEKKARRKAEECIDLFGEDNVDLR